MTFSPPIENVLASIVSKSSMDLSLKSVPAFSISSPYFSGSTPAICANSWAASISSCVHVGDLKSSESDRSEEHTSELQSRFDLVCRLLLEKKKQAKEYSSHDPTRLTRGQAHRATPAHGTYHTG